jgi:DNA polymerase
MSAGFFQSSVVQRAAPPSLIPRCGQCGLYKTCHSPKIKPYGKGAQRVLVVGEAPGKVEDEQGRPFVGPAGQYLRKALYRFGADLDEDAWTTNALICRPPDNATPDVKQISYCRPNVLAAIRKYEPNVIVTLGKSALVSVLEGYWRNVEALERWIGWQIPLERHWICPTYHPAYLLRVKSGQLDRLFSGHLQAAFELLEPPPKQPNWEQQVEVLLDDQAACDAILSLEAEGGWVAVDYETNCIKPEWPEGRIISCALANARRTISYLWTPAVWKATEHLLRSERVQKIAANLKMEERWTRHVFGRGVTNWGWDTMLASHCLDNRPGICSLKFQALVKLGVPSYNETIEPYLASHKGPYNRQEEIYPPALLTYGGVDARLEYELAMIQRKEMGFT